MAGHLLDSRKIRCRRDIEAPNEKVAMKMAIRRAESINVETLVAIPAEEARKLVD